ncbi:MAG: CNNM domain-containing protein [Planctomycetota bacterium]
MILGIEALALALLVAMSAIYSGSEIGFYSVSRVQVDLDARSGSWRASVMRWLMRSEAALLVTILIGNNLALELATHVAESMTIRVSGIHDDASVAVIVTIALTPVVFLFGEALPKDVFRQRPHALTGIAAPVIALSRIAFWPLERALRLLTVLLERLLGLEAQDAAPSAGKEALQGFIAEGRRHGVVSERAEALAHNALRLRTIPVRDAMVPWDAVECLDPNEGLDVLFERVRGSRFSRIPVVVREADHVRVDGYVHQLEVLHRWTGDADQVPDVLERIRPLQRMAPDVSVDRALNTFAASGRRIALVTAVRTADGDGAAHGASKEPEEILGLISVNDLLDRISDEVVG